MGPPFAIAKLVNITPISLWFMIPIVKGNTIRLYMHWTPILAQEPREGKRDRSLLAMFGRVR